MGKTYRESVAALMARYEALWAQADAEYDRDGEISKATMHKIADAELDMALLGI